MQYLFFLFAYIEIIGMWLFSAMHFPKWDAPAWAQIIAALTALVAVILGPYLQWKIAHRQFADNISSKRQIWIDELRKDFSEMLQLIGRAQGLKAKKYESKEEFKALSTEYIEITSRITELSIRTRLRLNPNESDHNRLKELMGDLVATCKDPSPKDTEEDRKKALTEFKVARENIISHLQIILKKEWERIKTGE